MEGKPKPWAMFSKTRRLVFSLTFGEYLKARDGSGVLIFKEASKIGAWFFH